MALTCPSCHEAAADYVGMADDGRNKMRCTRCEHHWLHGDSPVSPRARSEIAATRGRSGRSGGIGTRAVLFPQLTTVDDATFARVASLEARFRSRYHRPHPDAPAYRARYRRAFSVDGLPGAPPRLLKDFANDKTLASPGIMSEFNTGWNLLGDQEAAGRFRGVVEYLLRGPGEIENRLTELIDPSSRIGMRGFRESMLTLALCVAEPQRYIPILTYTSENDVGKREIARRVLGVDMPRRAETSHSIGRLVHWSNDLIVDALATAGVDVTDRDYVAGFLWWAKNQK